MREGERFIQLKLAKKLGSFIPSSEKDERKDVLKDSRENLNFHFNQRVDQVILSKTIKTEVSKHQGTEHRGLGASGAPEIRAWIPPSLRPQHGLSEEAQRDEIFRKVRGILNKITPEKFNPLSDDLLSLNLNSKKILLGVIHLIFEKALDEPKYSSMYAQLCRRISREGSTIEAEGDSRYTFETLLIRVCQDKFVNRSQYSQKIIDSHASEDLEEEELRYIAKQKVLGNVKFIGELFKLEMLNAATLHKMLEQLLDKKSRPYPTLEDRCEDMECLSQIFRTCGRQLDTEMSKNLIDQYFDNMENKSNNFSKYPARIRFMLRDVIELRKDGWKPRKATKVDGPVPIQDLNTDEDYMRQQRNRTMEYQQRNADRNWMDKLPLSLQSMNNYSGTLSMTSSSSMISGPYNSQERGNNGYNSYNNSSNSREPMNRPMNKHNSSGGGSHDNKMNNKYNKQQYNNNNMHHRSNNQRMDQRMDGHHNSYRHDSGSGGNGGHYNNSHQPKFNQNPYNNNNNTNSNNNNNNNNNSLNSLSGGNAKELAPRFKRNLVTTTTPSVDDLQMRPPQNSLLFKASNINKSNPQQLPMNQHQNRSGTSSPGLNTTSLISSATVDNLIPAFNNTQFSNGSQQTPEVSKPASPAQNQPSSPQNNHQKSEQIAVTKQGSIEKPKAKKDKGPSREDVLKKVSQFLSDTLFNKSFMEQLKDAEIVTDPINNNSNGHTNGKSEIIEECADIKNEENLVAAEEEEEKLNEDENPSIKSLDDVVKLYYDLKVPDKFLKDAIVKILNESLDKDDQTHESAVEFLMAMQKDKKLTTNQILDALKTVIGGMSEREKTIPKVTTHVASLLARSMTKKICKLNDIANFTSNGQHYPLLLLVLQQLHKTIGEEQLVEVFNACKINLMSSLPECDRTKERLAEILDDRKLSFLQPLLRIESELWRQIKEDPQPQTFYKWIKDNVDPIRYTDPGFITALMTVILRFITQDTTLPENGDTAKAPEKQQVEAEKKLLVSFSRILNAFLNGNQDLQLIAIYSLQIFCYHHQFPKGMLLRWFTALYELEIADEEAFLRWKDEVRDDFPGKPKALFQVNSWLTWLQEAESEEEDDE